LDKKVSQHNPGAPLSTRTCFHLVGLSGKKRVIWERGLTGETGSTFGGSARREGRGFKIYDNLRQEFRGRAKRWEGRD